MSDVAVIYVGPHAAGTIDTEDAVIEFVAGEVVKVPAGVAKGSPGRSGLLDQPGNWKLASPGREKTPPEPTITPNAEKGEG